MESLQGHLLIASPHLHDPNFAQSVILMIEHHDEGALGLVLNRPLSLTLREFWKQIDDSECENDQQVRCGGPVHGPVMSLHGHADVADAEITAGVFVSTQRENIQTLVKSNRLPFQVYAGYSGWGAGQLESELKAGGWLQSDADQSIVFEMALDELWIQQVHRSGERLLTDCLGIDGFPNDPSLN